MDPLINYAVLLCLFAVLSPILKVYIRESVKRQKKDTQKEETFREMLQIQRIYERERKPYALEAKAIFTNLCKQGLLHRDDLVLIAKLLEECMGDYQHEYQGRRFKNEYHRIYAYLQNWHIDERQWQNIINYLNKTYEREEAKNGIHLNDTCDSDGLQRV
jgi:hypothetical protein